MGCSRGFHSVAAPNFATKKTFIQGTGLFVFLVGTGATLALAEAPGGSYKNYGLQKDGTYGSDPVATSVVDESKLPVITLKELQSHKYDVSTTILR